MIAASAGHVGGSAGVQWCGRERSSCEVIAVVVLRVVEWSDVEEEVEGFVTNDRRE